MYLWLKTTVMWCDKCKGGLTKTTIFMAILCKRWHVQLMHSNNFSIISNKTCTKFNIWTLCRDLKIRWYMRLIPISKFSLAHWKLGSKYPGLGNIHAYVNGKSNKIRTLFPLSVVVGVGWKYIWMCNKFYLLYGFEQFWYNLWICYMWGIV